MWGGHPLSFADPALSKTDFQKLFDSLDAPVRRIGSLDTFVAYQPALEDAILPQPATILKAIQELRAY